MGRREAGDGSMSTSERTELESLLGIASSDNRFNITASITTGVRNEMDKKGSCVPVRTPEEVKKHQHKHNLKHRYVLMETLGKGTYGKVKKAVERGSGKTVAIKSIRKEHITDDLDRVHIQREIEIVSSLKHPNIIRIHEVFESRDKIVIVMEYASGGELYDFVNERRQLSETEARKVFRQIASAVHYCHKSGIVHRDLKLENVLLDGDFNVKLADFGLSNHYQKGRLLQTYCGSPLYASPEIVKGLPYQGPEVDCWALGVLLYALVYGSMPFDGTDYVTLTQQISQATYRRPQPPSDACALIDWMLKVKVEERATVEDIANHWWVNWGFQEPVCDCPDSQECASPLLARYIDWQNRAWCAAGDSQSVCHASDLQSYYSFPRKHTGCRARGAACLKKSRKENSISPPAACSASTTAADKKKPKGILKAQSSFESALLPHLGAGEGTRPGHPASAGCPVDSQPPPACCQPSSKMPKKGILKKLFERESGYSSSPEQGDTVASVQCESRPSREQVPVRTEVARRRKGILKWNGKFSTSLDFPDEHDAHLLFPESLQQLLLPSGGSTTEIGANQPSTLKHSRPASVISDDSLLSSDSFDLLDLTTPPCRRTLSRGSPRSFCSSEEELEEERVNGERSGGGKKQQREGISMEERQEIFLQSREISEQL